MSGNLKARMMDRGRSSDRRPADEIEALIAEAGLLESGQRPAQTLERAQHLSIWTIAPDPVQPRRPMPDLLRNDWLSGHPIDQILAAWREAANSDLAAHGVVLDWPVRLQGTDDADPLTAGERLPTTLKAATRQWLSLIDLATSILHTGLEQPVTVYPYGDGWRLLVGERRLLAFHLLTFLGYPHFDQIPALARETYNPFSQASENGARQNLNAVATARQLALLLFAMDGIPIPDGTVPQSFYAQAARLTIKRGAAQILTSILGLPSVRMLQHYKTLLTLPTTVLQYADDYDWSEGKLRGWMKRAGGNEDLLIALANAEVEKELGQHRPGTPSLMERSMRAASRASQALHALSAFDREALLALPESQRKELADLAVQLAKTLRS